MKHFLSKKEKEDEEEIVELDVSFILAFLNKLVDIPSELMLLKYYHLRARGAYNTTEMFRTYLKGKIGVETDTDLYKTVSRNRYTKTVLKIKSTIDALIFREFGCEVQDAKFVSYKHANSESIVINIQINR